MAGCGGWCGRAPRPAVSGSSATISAVGAENEYANVIEQIGGKYVKVTAIESNPNTDPHTFEASPSVAQTVSAASLLIENGVGYDTYMEKIESAVRRLLPQGHQRAAPARPPGLHPEPAPLVQAGNDAGGREGAGQRPVGAAARARGVLPGKREEVRRIAEAVVRGDREVQGCLPEHAGRDDRAGRRLHARSRRDEEHDAVHAAGRRS